MQNSKYGFAHSGTFVDFFFINDLHMVALLPRRVRNTRDACNAAAEELVWRGFLLQTLRHLAFLRHH